MGERIRVLCIQFFLRDALGQKVVVVFWYFARGEISYEVPEQQRLVRKKIALYRDRTAKA
ncbi:MAG: hypothetical protein MUE84_14340 [Hyphomonas sp.]|nr:hypothetical protein [Hyphomonas sp.]